LDRLREEPWLDPFVEDEALLPRAERERVPPADLAPPLPPDARARLPLEDFEPRDSEAAAPFELDDFELRFRADEPAPLLVGFELPPRDDAFEPLTAN
jgi:hypothetical protein